MKLTEIQQPNIEQILQQLDVADYEITNEGVNVFGDVIIPLEWMEIPIQFNIVRGRFDCNRTELTSLQGAPKEVGSDFNCGWTNITSLQGAPREVGGDFICIYTKITSLQGAPKEVGGSFYCGNTKITSLQGAPREVGGNFYCLNTNIKSKPDITGINIGGELIWK